MKIGELAQTAQCSVETVRYYEKEGLLPAAERTASNYRSYGPAHIERLRFIRNCRALDMTQDEIRTLLGFVDDPAAGCGAVNHLVDEHLGHVQARIAELLELEKQLVELRHRCNGEFPVDACGIVQGLNQMDTEPKPAHRHTHLG
ncbi:Cd(II)/Pb(II)-responsive transcriptional regulator [Jeongeupia chitinilytica]|uniref:MerR family transcriptional regulator n=1 Tax=Jeongeupia chitinilytica TaxID=1041641 RepID=A0ABQ3H181_9NEIS|nr:Cd(II)/Pb(II)-responsive transcriptional regulator [Jeongeupia chitinilytica]GHD65297.1 MerR family transcriptional regulator [Jeongeupia chitinilytica]